MYGSLTTLSLTNEIHAITWKLVCVVDPKNMILQRQNLFFAKMAQILKKASWCSYVSLSFLPVFFELLSVVGKSLTDLQFQIPVTDVSSF